MLVIGVDPGINGAMALWSTAGGLLVFRKLPTCSVDRKSPGKSRNEIDCVALRELLRQWSRAHNFAGNDLVAVLERMQAYMSKGGVQTASPSMLMSLGDTFGAVRGVLSGFARTIVRPTPMQWKRGFQLAGVASTTAERKAMSVAEVRRRVGITVGHDVAEAILLAMWGAGEINGLPLAGQDDDDPFGVKAAA